MKFEEYYSETRLKRILSRMFKLSEVDYELYCLVQNYSKDDISFETFLSRFRGLYKNIGYSKRSRNYNKSILESYSRLIVLLSEYLGAESFHTYFKRYPELQTLASLNLTDSEYKILELFVKAYIDNEFLSTQKLADYFGCTTANIHQHLRRISVRLQSSTNIRLNLVRGLGFALISLEEDSALNSVAQVDLES